MVDQSPLEMCAVSSLLGGAFGRMFGGSPHFLFVFYRPDRHTNEHYEVLFIHKCSRVYQYKKLNSAYMKAINTSVYIYNSLVIVVLSTKSVLTRQIYDRRPAYKSLTAQISRGCQCLLGVLRCVIGHR